MYNVQESAKMKFRATLISIDDRGFVNAQKQTKHATKADAERWVAHETRRLVHPRAVIEERTAECGWVMVG